MFARTAAPLLLRGVAVLDPQDGKLTPAQDLLCEQGRIAAIAPTGVLPAQGRRLRVIDGGGRVACPGLIDAHLHVCGLYLTDQPTVADLRDAPAQIGKNLRALVRSGVTTVRDMGSPLNLGRGLRSLARAGRICSPRILIPGPVLTAPGGYPNFLEPLAPPLALTIGQVKAELRTEADARRWVDRLAAAAVDVIKVVYTAFEYDDARTPMPRLRDEVLVAVTDRAHHHNLPVAVHQIWTSDLHDLLALPFDTLEHLPIDAPISAADIERIRGRDLPVTTTLMTYGIIDFVAELAELVRSDAGARYTPAAHRTMDGLVQKLQDGSDDLPFIGRKVIDTGMRHQLTSLARLRAAGVRVVAGTDSGGAITPCGCIRWELESFQRAGYTALEALRAATTVAAEAIGRPELGRLAVGAPADLILTRDNPAQSVHALDQVDLVARAGRVLVDDLSRLSAGAELSLG